MFELIIEVEVRHQRMTSKLGMDLKDRLKTWEDLRRIDDYVTERDITFTCQVDSPPTMALVNALARDVFEPDANWINRVRVSANGGKVAIFNFKKQRGDRPETVEEAAARNLTTYVRRKGDPYVETD